MSEWRPSSNPAAARRRAELLDRARDYFAAQSVLAVDTPALSAYAASDPAIDSFAVQSAAGATYFLQTSPEFCMKRLLAADFPDIYSICRVFRDGEAGRKHLPEFTLIEWYRRDFDLPAMIADVAEFVARCLERPDLSSDTVILDYDDAFKTLAGIDVYESGIGDLAAAASADADLMLALGDDRDAWLDLILDAVVVPKFASTGLTVLRHFPASKAALARRCPADERFADRFEFFYGTVELANGYVELTDPVEQRLRFEADLDSRRADERNVDAWDPQLMQALESGLPECAGVAVGVERLQMIYDRTDDIADVVTFSGFI